MSIGRRLADARVERGLEVEDVSRATRIRPAIVRAIEADDLAAAGPAVYARGHLRSIATLLGVDPGPLVAEYDREHAQPAAVVPEVWQGRSRAVARADRGSPRWLGAMVVTMLVVVGLLAVGTAVDRAPDSDSLTVATGPTAVPEAPTSGDPVGPADPGPADPGPADPGPADPGPADPGPADPGPADPGPAPAGTEEPTGPDDRAPTTGSTGGATGGAGGVGGAGQLAVRVSVPTGRSWFEVTSPAGESLFAGVLEAGEAEEFTSGGELRLTIGDASSARLEVDGRQVAVPGGQGQVAKLLVRPGGDVSVV